jgi:hypothetical protein
MPDAMVVFSAPDSDFRRAFGLGFSGTMRLAVRIPIAVRTTLA